MSEKRVHEEMAASNSGENDNPAAEPAAKKKKIKKGTGVPPKQTTTRNGRKSKRPKNLDTTESEREKRKRKKNPEPEIEFPDLSTLIDGKKTLQSFFSATLNFIFRNY